MTLVRVQFTSFVGETLAAKADVVMSALHPNADIDRQETNIRFVPKADITSSGLLLIATWIKPT
jgi:hypothetical protein